VQASASNKPCHASWRSIIPNANRPLHGGTEKTLRMTGYDRDVPNFVSQWGQVCALAQLCHWRALSARACSYPLPLAGLVDLAEPRSVSERAWVLC
jgi:hypothetical protein